LGLPVSGRNLFDFLLRVREKLIRGEFEIELVLEKRSDNGRFVIDGRAFRKTEFGHGTKIDPFLFRVQHLPQFLDIDIVDQTTTAHGNCLQGVHHIGPASGQVKVHSTMMRQTTDRKINLPVVFSEQSQPLFLDLQYHCT